MKKYVILTEILSGLTGSPRYVNRKCKMLREDGWEVVVIWSNNVSPVQLEHVKCFDDLKFIHHELRFYPAWFSEKGRNKVINRLVSMIGDSNQIVIESNTLVLGAWGELLARKLRCKHIVNVVTEKVMIQSKATFDFCYAKLNRDEFFSISEAAVKYLFSGFVDIEKAEKYYWNASPGVVVEEYPFPAFDELPMADYTVTHFGRYKSYFPKLISELSSFISIHPDKKFNVFILGNGYKKDDVTKTLNQSNVHVAFHPEVVIIPKQIFDRSNVVIATAGCASIASRHIPYVIAMDVNTYEPLGLLRRTTLDSNTSSGNYNNDKSLNQWLDSILIKKETYPLIESRRVYHGYPYQMQFISRCDHVYVNSVKVNERTTRHDGLYAFLTKIGLFRVVEFFYYKRRGVKVIWR